MKNLYTVFKPGDRVIYRDNQLNIFGDVDDKLTGAEIEATVDCIDNLAAAYDKFAAAFNQAVDDGVIEKKIMTYAEWDENVSKGEWALEEDCMWGHSNNGDGTFSKFAFEKHCYTESILIMLVIYKYATK